MRSSSRRATTGSTGSAYFFFLGLELVLGVHRLLGTVLGVRVLGVLVLDVKRCFLRGLARLIVGSLELVHLVRALDDVELVVDLVGLDGVVQVLVRHGGCFFLDTEGWNMRKGRRIPRRPSLSAQPKTYLAAWLSP